jgi:hypothetical protein
MSASASLEKQTEAAFAAGREPEAFSSDFSCKIEGGQTFFAQVRCRQTREGRSL